MADDRIGWASGLGLSDQLVERFTTISEQMGMGAADLVGLLVAHIVKSDENLHKLGLSGIAAGAEPEASVRAVVQHSGFALPGDIRPTGFMWPSDKPFPWTAEECRAAVIGYAVRWHGTFDDFRHHLPGRWDLLDGYAVLWPG